MSNMQFPRIILTRMQDPAIKRTFQQRALEELKFEAIRIVLLILPVISYMHIIKFVKHPLFHTCLQI